MRYFILVVALLLDPAACCCWPPPIGALMTQGLTKAAVALRTRFWRALARQSCGRHLEISPLYRGNRAVPIVFSDRAAARVNVRSNPEFFERLVKYRAVI